MKINGTKINLFRDVIKPAVKNMFNFKHNILERSPNTDIVKVNLINNTPGIKSKTFKTLLTPEFTPKNNTALNGMKITTLIDKKTKKPVEAFVAKVEEAGNDAERYWLMVKDKAGEIDVQGENFRIVGETYFYVDKKNKLITPKTEMTFINGEMYEKLLSYMSSKDNEKYAGIGTRLHQLRVERMLQNNLGNVRIVADGNSFPFHYSMGYRLIRKYRPAEEAAQILHEFSYLTKLSPRECAKYLIVEVKDNKEIINFSASLENCLNDYYRNGGKNIEEFTPDMFLDKTSLDQWIEMIKKQPILY